ncbi:mutator MutT protein [Cutibacterium acnes JCM 18909]|nr:mutator MutT protein [Cutibacterium acnes JCM 18909]
MMTPILTTLGFVMHPDGERVLMVHRIARPGDEQLGKYNGLGGKVEPGEDVVAGMKRELREELRSRLTPCAYVAPSPGLGSADTGRTISDLSSSSTRGIPLPTPSLTPMKRGH